MSEISILKALEELREQDRICFSFYKPHPKALEFHNLDTQARDRLFLAANRIGKTMACSLEVCMHATGNYPEWWEGHRYNKPVNVWVAGITEKEINILERRYFDGDVGELPWVHPSLVLYRNQTKHTYHILHTSGTISIITFKTYQQGKLTWQGEKLDLCHLDEEPPAEIYVEASLRLMSTSADHCGKMLISATCLYYSRFVQLFTEETVDMERADDNGNGIIVDKKQVQNREGEIKNGKVFLMAGWDDAPHLTKDEQDHLKSKIPPHEIEARSKGIPSIGSGMVYPISEHFITCDPFEIPRHFYCVAGMDFGWKDPTAVVFCAIDKDKDIFYVFEEYAQSERTPQQHLTEMMKMRLARSISEIPIVYDPAGRISSQKDGESLVSLYKQARLNMHRANNSREAGAQTVLQRMQNGKLKIFKTCNKLLSELRMYARDEEGMIKDGNDHLLDAMRYAVMSGIQIAKTKELPYGYKRPVRNGYM